MIRGTTNALNNSTNIFLDGQPIYEKTSDGKTRFKIGDGVNIYKELPYINDFIDIYTDETYIRGDSTTGVKLSCDLNTTSSGTFPVLDISGYSPTSSDSNIVISGVANPSDNFQAANKRYVDASAPIGSITMYAGVGTNLPTAYSATWAFCDGSLMTKSRYPELFEAIGYTYGKGQSDDDIFLLPNLEGRFVLGYNPDITSQGYNLGDKAGTEQHSHTYGIQFQAYFGTLVGPDETMIQLFDKTSGWNTTNTMIQTNQVTANAGLQQYGNTQGSSLMRSTADTAPQYNYPPYIVLKYIIKVR